MIKKYNIVCTGVSTPPQKHHSPLSYQALPLKSANCPSPPLLGNPPFYIGFSWTPTPKNQIFQWTFKILKFFILNTILSFKSN